MQYSIRKLKNVENGRIYELNYPNKNGDAKKIIVMGDPIISGNRRTVNYPLVQLTGLNDGKSWIFDVVFSLSESFFDYEEALIEILKHSFGVLFDKGFYEVEPVTGCVDSLEGVADLYKIHGRSILGG